MLNVSYTHWKRQSSMRMSHTHTHTHTKTGTLTHTNHARTHSHVHTQTHKQTHTQTGTLTHSKTYTRKHNHTHTHTITHKQKYPSSAHRSGRVGPSGTVRSGGYVLASEEVCQYSAPHGPLPSASPRVQIEKQDVAGKVTS